MIGKGRAEQTSFENDFNNASDRGVCGVTRRIMDKIRGSPVVVSFQELKQNVTKELFFRSQTETRTMLNVKIGSNRLP